MTTKTIGQMTAEIREVNIDKGWRPAAGGPAANTFGDYVALLHSEVSEALEAYRDHRLKDATTITVHATPPHGRPKPQGVGSELADTLIRLLDMCDVFAIRVFDMDMELADVADLDVRMLNLVSFGDWITALHVYISKVAEGKGDTPAVLRMLVTTARQFGIDLNAEYERKITFNRTRAFQHGGRTLTEEPTGR